MTTPIYLDVIIDMISSFSIGSAGYCLLRGLKDKNFRPSTKEYIPAVVILVILLILVVASGVPARNESIFWKVLYLAPNTTFATTAGLLVAVAILLDSDLNFVRWPAAVILMIYSILQMPFYFLEILEQAQKNPGSIDASQWIAEAVFDVKRTLYKFTAAGKSAIFLMFIAGASVMVKEQLAVTFVSVLRWVTMLMSAAFAIYVLFYHILEFVYSG